LQNDDKKTTELLNEIPSPKIREESGTEARETVIQAINEDTKKTTAELKKGQTKSKRKMNSFLFVSLSAGADLSFVNSEKPGSAQLLTGAGLGYTFRNGLSLSTGFYSGRKVYSSSAANYNPPPQFLQYYPILENVNADCKVYEIPLSIKYNFGNKRQNWFIGAGLSSLLMKKEKYNYTYKYTAAGPSYNKNFTINNQNKHFFSIATISGGVQRHLNKSISLTVEPYFKLPLQGVGYGKVKLNSGGIVFTLSTRLFDKTSSKTLK
jgi:hypothetical protein